jgi:hypothetical protein
MTARPPPLPAAQPDRAGRRLQRLADPVGRQEERRDRPATPRRPPVPLPPFRPRTPNLKDAPCKLMAVLRIRIRIRIHMFLGLLDPDPDPLVRGMDPDPDPALDPDPSIIKPI